ncbi:unnamed protein product [Cylindrotheca closterium]|uniref:Aminopeptidase n=1 Tax=Cylindrotheca closterium TaxID=2856 RepID=A0AAD2FD44_9STRA|nr:unnamed protein product [Cylindrotheca closterium]
MQGNAPKTTNQHDHDHNDGFLYRSDYTEPAYWVTHVNLDFQFYSENSVQVTSELTVVPNTAPAAAAAAADTTTNHKKKKNHNHNDNDDEAKNLILNGDSKRLQLISIALIHMSMDEEDKNHNDNGDDPSSSPIRLLTEGVDYEYDKDSPSDLIIFSSTLLGAGGSKGSIRLQLVVELDPTDSSINENNKGELSGLYFRDHMFCTHCEPSGFRQITYFPDRPDNCATYSRVRLEANQEQYPILLSNGNLIESGIVATAAAADGGNHDDDSSSVSPPIRHYAIFQDPHPKPSYIFGLVVANNHHLDCIRDSHVTSPSGKQVQLVLYGEPDQIPKLTFAMETLKKAMKWDEDTYGLEYDLDTYTIVAAKHFNIGAMENKGLNLFMTSLIATDPSCTTDVTYDLVEKTIAHEYFHNWSGNRVTVRDWFEFTLKEGLTVYRDQEFTSSHNTNVGSFSLATRIEAVKLLREKQFVEDASEKLRQPIRPERYLLSSSSSSSSQQHSLDSLATSTTYHKGAEVCRMYKTLVGKEGFRNGLNLYMSRHDGTGATCDDFWRAMADANNELVDLEQFPRWYSTAGTPTVSYEYHYCNENGTLELTLSQRLTHLTNEKDGGPLLQIPVAVGLLDKATGKEVVPTIIFDLKDRTETMVFDGLEGEVVPSLLRGFSAPVYLVPAKEQSKTDEEAYLSLLAAYDTDDFNRWEAMQELLTRFVLDLLDAEDELSKSSLEPVILNSFGNILTDPKVDASSKSYLLNLPTEAILLRSVPKPCDPVALLDARKRVMGIIGQFHQSALQEVYDDMTSKVLSIPIEDITDANSRAIRSLRNRCLEYLVAGHVFGKQPEQAAFLAKKHFEQANCFTDHLTAFRQIASLSGNTEAVQLRDKVTLEFFQLAFTESASESPSTSNTILNKWFQIQALADLEDALPRIQSLMQENPHFQANNAGRFRSLITSFTKNTRSFHTQAGYQFVGHIIRQMDRRSPILATEMARELAKWPQIKGEQADWMVTELRQIVAMEPISKPLLTTVSRALREMTRTSETVKAGGNATPPRSFGKVAAKPGTKSKKKNKKKTSKAKKGFA